MHSGLGSPDVWPDCSLPQLPRPIPIAGRTQLPARIRRRRTCPRFGIPHRFHSGRLPGAKEPATTIVCNFTLRLDDGTPFGLSEELRHFPPSQETRRLFLTLAEIWHQPFPDLLRTKSCLYQLFAVLCSQERHHVMASGPFADIAPAIQYLEKELNQDKSVRELAAMCHVSVSKFRQLFHAYAGMAPTAFRIANKLERAKLLLEFDRR